MNHFELFGLPPAPELDVAALEKRYRELALEQHPDRHAGADPATRRRLAAQTAALNDALKVLRDPVRRSFYLLKLRGVDLEREGEAGKQALAPDFLEEVLERREALDAVKKQRDLARAQAMGAEVRALLEAALARANAALARPASDAAAVAQATLELSRVRYFTRYLEEVEAFEEESL